ncbi:nucleotide exchange factor GrpE [Candidatus Collierbacteria bacterium RIFCSPLOWO2_01_FULL_50_23]|uniref:Protein GrpE n=2 Tax=Candidatus Collieribacteriota TaxID=1752725 RepID=A0A1F5EWJ0_9BACT|nr:MAG: nucleotide exchange factor GrpE [Candidatus Collierbacteria bacterium RIFCSPHIGHO2_01_FULL_50_25]OGD71720.1 MAG: nucleotide exchange factor GrpE [Candidatus Collierbacteria bacterium RIFCSPHIGHO2_02_FULL_49_10]OGD75007.1 MAG: nucleotide exchange factor GrpE [Candidatus Collierbacteria bacterium RIFCSPLOWO2_01_FULL_50_23]
MTKTTKPREMEVLKEQLTALDDKFKRALADYQNQEKRHASQKSVFIKFANETLLEKIIPILDDLERAQSHLNDTGLGHVIKQFHLVLSGEGISVIESDNADFDPATMDCAEVVAGEKDKVVKTLALGYRLYDKVLRPAKVEVGNGVANEDPAKRDNTNNEVKP